MKILSNAAATIAEGEVLQLTARKSGLDETVYFQVVRENGASSRLRPKSWRYGMRRTRNISRPLCIWGCLGHRVFRSWICSTSYQGVSGETGKNIGSDDFRERKLTLPVIKAIALADDEERAFTRTHDRAGQTRPVIWNDAVFATKKAQDARRNAEDALGWAKQSPRPLAPCSDHDIKGLVIWRTVCEPHQLNAGPIVLVDTAHQSG
jgi:octaprenyl-diphosphate synthase